MIGPLILVIGLLGLWALVRGKAGPVLDALSKSGFSESLDNSLGNLKLVPTDIRIVNAPAIAQNGSSGTVGHVPGDGQSGPGGIWNDPSTGMPFTNA